MKRLSDDALRIREDAVHSGYKLGAKSTERLITLLVELASAVDYLREREQERRAGLPGYD